MRFAFETPQEHTTWADLLALWRQADALDVFESGWLYDHLVPILGDASGPCLEGWTALAALAQATVRLRLGVLVTGTHFRHPSVLAKMATTLDIVSGGRLELGLGAGWNHEEADTHGIRLGAPRERSERLEETCAVLTGLMSQETFSFTGTHYRLTEARHEPKGPQRPHPPLCIGGGGERRTLRTVARYAQHWNFGEDDPAEFARKRDVLFGHCRALGRDPADITLSAHVRLGPGYRPGSTGRPDALRNRLRALADEGLDLAVIQLLPPYRPEAVSALADALTDLP
ncbi:TIGR03560 family F420-dependent LLM class oxidoreductase [Streptomyces sp. SDr-06]|uniref:TIGR03560 family F420-dependent LLM class oxidoreductase n=1 Tax=Streptomyces sp. SDr-06 TaxID=2267702 RepID=UPI000DE8302B|nr:TIGR03560 family F420-dependent LLM class oxidoreductase [Streptomyces sp. SDr-06]RCH67775.1 TIGR03560 family F420-dependent LLM class oxidoreductase [Streptomyces sp. SDr-06]